MTQTYPLKWPDGWPRAKWRKPAKFGTTESRSSDAGSWKVKSDMTMAEAMKRVRYELERLGVNVQDDSVVSTNLRLNLAGLPRGDQGEPGDPGAAVYFQKKNGPMRVIAVDAYTRVRDNLAAIAATLDAMRAIERHGGAQILERAFTGFTALPAPDAFDPWAVLGLRPGATREAVEGAFRARAKLCHPDAPGGSHGAFQRLERARREALA